jgi:hypothetical protein
MTTTQRTPSYTATGLRNGTTYHFRVIGHNAVGSGRASNTVSARPYTVPGTPHAPTSRNGYRQITLTWPAVASNGAVVDFYVVQRSVDGINFVEVARPTSRSYRATGLINETTYYFRIRAHNAAGYSGVSAPTGATPTAADVTRDGIVDCSDVDAILAKWNQSTTGAEDINGDGIVNLFDLTFVLNRFQGPAEGCSTAPPPQTFTETTGGLANTWTNYTNAGGTAGPQIGAHVTVQVACRVQGFRVADGNTWWYRIASAPWNGQYYASADIFYNIPGMTSGSLSGTPFVDESVTLC